MLLIIVAAISAVTVAGIVLATNELDMKASFKSEIVLPLLVVTGVIALLASLAIVASAFGLFDLADKTQPLGLPAGSVQAVIALSLILIFAVVALFLQNRAGAQIITTPGLTLAEVNQIPQTELVDKFPQVSKGKKKNKKTTYTVIRRVEDPDKKDLNTQLLTTVSTLVVAVAGFYFGSKSVQEGSKAAVDAVIAPPRTLTVINPQSPIELKRGKGEKLKAIRLQVSPDNAPLTWSIGGDKGGSLVRLENGDFEYTRGEDAKEIVTLSFRQVDDASASADLIVKAVEGPDDDPASDVPPPGKSTGKTKPAHRKPRPLNVVLRPQSPALEAYAAHVGIPRGTIAAGFEPRPDLDLTHYGGRTIADLSFVNCYLGGASAWSSADRDNIDKALAEAMSDPGLEEVIAQYYPKTKISSTALPSWFVDEPLGARFYKDEAKALAGHLFAGDMLGKDAKPEDLVICLMLPKGVVLVDGNSDGNEVEAPHARTVLVDDDQVDSRHGLGGFHGSVDVDKTTVYYAVGVYSEGGNGIVAFDEPWKNVVATFYHELNEARTNPNVEKVIRTGDESLLGWYSRTGGEIGDIPMLLAGADLSKVMVEAPLRSGGTAPIQLQWSNAVHGPEGPALEQTSPAE